MRHWTFWEWVAYACLLLGAVILAADTGLKVAPDLARHFSFIESPFWGFAPLALVVAATIIFVANEFGWLEAIGFRRTPEFFLERDPDTGRYGIQTFPGVTYIQISVRATKPLEKCIMWIGRVEFRENEHIPFAEVNNERHQLRWARPNQSELDLSPDHPPARATIGVYTPQLGLTYETLDRTPSNLYPNLQRIGTHRFSLVFSGESNRRIVSSRLFFYLDWRGIDGGAFVRIE